MGRSLAPLQASGHSTPCVFAIFLCSLGRDKVRKAALPAQQQPPEIKTFPLEKAFCLAGSGHRRAYVRIY